MTEKFTCAMCKGTFEKARTDEEAAAALVNEFPGFNVEECDVVCGDCYENIEPQKDWQGLSDHVRDPLSAVFLDRVSKDIIEAFQIPAKILRYSDDDAIEGTCTEIIEPKKLKRTP